MYSNSNSSCLDLSTALHKGTRGYQEDCIIADFPVGRESGFAILADGMGAHASGDRASSLVVACVFSLLKANISILEETEEAVTDTLKACVEQANATIREHVQLNPDDRGMGSTLVILFVLRDRLYWASVGDSPLYVIREGDIQQLNEDHSMAPRIAAMVAAGQLSREKAASHPDRNALTSAISGGEVTRIDCPETPFELRAGDTVILASDGLQTLRNEEILKTVRRNGQRSTFQLTAALLQAVLERQNPDQDNTSIIAGRFTALEGSVDVLSQPEGTNAKNGEWVEETDDIVDAFDADVEEASDALLEAMSL